MLALITVEGSKLVIELICMRIINKYTNFCSSGIICKKENNTNLQRNQFKHMQLQNTMQKRHKICYLTLHKFSYINTIYFCFLCRLFKQLPDFLYQYEEYSLTMLMLLNSRSWMQCISL